MTFIPVDFESAVEPVAAPIGSYVLQITECKVAKTGAQSKRPDSPQFRISLAFAEDDQYQNITHFIPLPHEDDDANSTKFKVLLLKRFCAHFNIPLYGTGIDTEQLAMEMVGAEALTEVTVGEPNDNGDVFNGIKVPRLRGESDDRR